MAKVTQKSGLAGKLGPAGQKAVIEHKDEPVNFGGGGDLPDGINAGVAQLVDCRFDQYKDGSMQGEYFFLAAGVVIAPEVHDNVRVAGLRTQIMEPMCDTPDRSRKTISEHVAWVLNEMRKLGVDTSSLGIDDLEPAAAALKGESPHFRFRTWKGKKQTTGPFANQEPRVQEQWKGSCEFDGEATTAVEDHSVEAVPDDEVEAAASGDVDIAALGKAADAGDEDASATLEDLANAKGIDAGEIATWVEVAEMLLAEGEPVAADETTTPKKGEIWYYKPPKAKKYAECEVTAVFDKAQKVNIKNLDTQESYKSIEFDKLKADNPA